VLRRRICSRYPQGDSANKSRKRFAVTLKQTGLALTFSGVWRHREANASMRSVIVALVLSAGVVIAIGTAAAPDFNHQTTAPLARAIIDGLVLGSTAWPSTPLDVQARLQLRPTGCGATGPCDPLEE
jgi:hypothetical protein